MRMSDANSNAPTTRILRLIETETRLEMVRFRLPKALSLGFEQIVLGEATGEAQEPRVRDHAV
jgi:hypothetical protein